MLKPYPHMRFQLQQYQWVPVLAVLNQLLIENGKDRYTLDLGDGITQDRL